MKHLVLKTKYALLALLVVFAFSCDGEDGAPGAEGPAGAAGAAGINGNANVEVITIDMSTESGSFDDVTVPELTQDVIDNDVILGYIRRGSSLHPVPTVEDSSIIPFGVSVSISTSTYTMDYVDGATGGAHSISAGDIDELKVVIIESTSGKTGDSKQQIYNELAQAGVNMSDYYAVANYYGITN